MKPFLIRLARIYFRLGAVFGGLGILSYAWGAATQSDCRDFVLSFMLLPYAVFGAAVRTVLWLPSLIHWWSPSWVHWWFASPEPTFLQWLLPGLFMTCGTS